MSLSLLLTRLLLLLRPTVTRPRGERGDVPGWVMVTVLTVALAIAVFTVAETQLKEMLRGALSKVK